MAEKEAEEILNNEEEEDAAMIEDDLQGNEDDPDHLDQEDAELDLEENEDLDASHGEELDREGDKSLEGGEEMDNPDKEENEEDKEEGGEDADAGVEDDRKEETEEQEPKLETSKEGEEEEDEEEDDDEEEGGERLSRGPVDPNVMPQVNVQILAKRRWQVKVYPLKPADFMSGLISKVFKTAKESLLYLISAGKHSRGKGEMYVSSARQTVQVVQRLMNRDSYFHETNIEIVKKNDEGVVEEKAYMRFDSKMVQMLFTPPDSRYSWGMHGRKRERLIGSVFVKNLPPNTSKDMLLVMFPFAQEINYNPEKFKECTARLVLKSRQSVIPCLKAFAKVELGGQVLELHPLEKKRTTSRDPKSKSESRHRSRSTSVKSDKDESTEKDDDSKTEKEKEKAKPKEESNGTETKDKESPAKKSEAGKTKSDSTDQKPRRKIAGGFGARPTTTRKPLSKHTEEESDRSKRDRKDFDRPKRPFNRLDSRGGRGSRGRGRSDGFRSRNFSGNRRGGFGSRGRGGSREGGYSSAMKSDAMNTTEATKDMLVLQNQLSMAIKSQLAVLNQTKMAVEQAKIGASGLGLGVGGAGSSAGMLGGSGVSQMSDLDRGYSPRGPARDRRDVGGYGGQKRKAQQAGMRQSERGYGKRPFRGKGSQSYGRSGARGGGGGGARSSNYSQYEDRLSEEYRREMYARADDLRAAESAYGSSSYGSGGAGGYADSYGYGYY